MNRQRISAIVLPAIIEMFARSSSESEDALSVRRGSTISLEYSRQAAVTNAAACCNSAA